MDNLIQSMQSFVIEHSEKQVAEFLFTLIIASILWFGWQILYFYLNKISDKTKIVWDNVLLLALKTPTSVMIWSWPILTGARLLVQVKLHQPTEWVDTLQQIIMTYIPTWALIRLVANTEQHVLMDRKKDPTTVHAIGKIIRLILVILCLLAILQILGLSLSGLLAFSGAGGLVAGMAAKDLLANFFGGAMIYLDQPFKVGDWIRSPDRNIEGTVEDIGWRITSIRTFDQRPIYVPNSVFSNIVVENPSRMHNRRISETISVRYQDAAKMDAMIKEIRAMLNEHPDIDQRQILIVNFSTFGTASLNIMLYVFTKTVDWVRYQEVKQNVLLKIIDIIKSNGADIALPTHKMHIENDAAMINEISMPK